MATTSKKTDGNNQAELPLVYQLRRPRKSEGVEERPEEAAAGEDLLLESRTTPFNSFVCPPPQKFCWSSDGRYFYAVWKDRPLVVLDLVLNTQKEFTSKPPFRDYIWDFVVVDRLTLVVNTWGTLYLFRLNDEEGSFEAQELEFPDGRRSFTTFILTEIIGGNEGLKRAVLWDGLGEWFVFVRLDVREGRVYAEPDDFHEIGLAHS